MKKFLITISPICVVLFIFMGISWGLKGVFVFFGLVLYTVVLVVLITKWTIFVDKHIKD